MEAGPGEYGEPAPTLSIPAPMPNFRVVSGLPSVHGFVEVHCGARRAGGHLRRVQGLPWALGLEAWLGSGLVQARCWPQAFLLCRSPVGLGGHEGCW